MTEMLSERQSAKIAIDCVRGIFGSRYLQENRAGTCLTHGYWPESNEYMLFLGIKDSRDLPNHPKTPKGWTVFAEVWIDTVTGTIKKMTYQTE